MDVTPSKKAIKLYLGLILGYGIFYSVGTFYVYHYHYYRAVISLKYEDIPVIAIKQISDSNMFCGLQPNGKYVLVDEHIHGDKFSHEDCEWNVDI